jgi:hypothetical protein
MKEEFKDIPVRHEHHEMLPVWFFVGVLLLVYGLIILYIGIRDYAHPAPVVLAKYHAPLWGGIVLTLLGGGYTLRFWPRRPKLSN